MLPSMAEPAPAAIYCRISQVRDGSTLGVDRQEPPIRALCERLGWKVERVFVDEDLIDLAEQYGIKLATVTGEYDLATPSGRLHFRIKGAIARHESEHRAERARLKQEELARDGKVGGGGTRPFGYLEDRV